ncbi:MAG: hypothetical protein HOM14_19290 [Gammaproteobacteria bacterium]|jgi:hypothetical protein|nr:hypothetical protein [Gammaproteobacteria bacterium]MBT3722557.1 hypothetical protein [Gammaproteobacteria bacterium]MBT4196984.1 hypothetical protein [Gammaproteobacteria bacterium]MBT4451840.1 hypothetical protein [Gammaproteobacteria bacterium]MBT4860752.1 hypothetical protein [Gammaproteobacteria bacterium]
MKRISNFLNNLLFWKYKLTKDEAFNLKACAMILDADHRRIRQRVENLMIQAQGILDDIDNGTMEKLDLKGIAEKVYPSVKTPGN